MIKHPSLKAAKTVLSQATNSNQRKNFQPMKRHEIIKLLKDGTDWDNAPDELLIQIDSLLHYNKNP